jgi:ABC-2 type transport system permease protein
MSAPGSLAWFARHEFRLAWRDWLAMMTAGGRIRVRTLAIALAAFALVMHAVAFAVVPRLAETAAADKSTLVVITVSMLLTWSLMLSQAMERVARAFYARADLELLLSSPIEARRIFAVRLVAIAVSIVTMAALITAPFIDVLTAQGGAQWLAGYGAVAAIGAAAAAVATILTAVLFETIGPKQTRLVAQIVAAVIGAGFVIALQLAVIASTGTLSRVSFFTSEPFIASLVLLGASIAVIAPRFAGCVIAAAGAAHASARPGRHAGGFCARAPVAMLRRKEWMLLARDPWLASQTLMQLLYLLPPAFLLWRSFGGNSSAGVLLVPVLVMAAGQLAGGLAWLMISGEDAPDLIMTAPVVPGRILRAKIEAVMGAIVIVFAPLLVGLALISPFCASLAAFGVMLSAASSTYVQLCFRAQAKRSHFRRRHASSQVATYAEAFVSIGWAAAAALAASGTLAAAAPAAMAVAVLAGARHISPRTP